MDWLDINEFHNVRIDSKSKCYTNTLSCDEEFYLMAKTNADDGDAVEIHLNLLDKNQAILKTIELESHVENEEVKMTLKIEDLAKENLLDFNAIKEINAEFHYENEKYPTNKARVCRTLKSKELSDSSELNDIVECKVVKAYKKGKGTVPNSKGDEVKLIQTSLQKMKINIGDDGVDGVFGNDGHDAVMTFQENYKPIHNVHQYTWDEPDGIVGKNTLLAMDEALVSGWKYTNSNACKINIDTFIKKYTNIHTIWDSQNSTYLKRTLNASSKLSLKKLLTAILEFYANSDKCPLPKIAYMLATVKLETYNYLTGVLFEPISELGGDDYAAKMYDPILGKTTSRKKTAFQLGNAVKGDGVKYKGRGFVQITGKNNYQKFKTLLNIDLITYPEKAIEWDTSFKIMTIGMRDGTFTGKKLSEYFTDSSTDYYNARRIINGTDHASVIKKYAEEFEKCLISAKS